METKNLIIAVIVAAVIGIAVYYFFIKGKSTTETYGAIYSEASLACDLGMDACTLTTGMPGLCDPTTRMCVHAMDWNNRPSVYPNQSPIGQPSYECTLINKSTCTRRDGEMGVCMTNLCYPETAVVN
jgi:hypothetical protein